MDVAALLARQAGVVSLAQAVDAGVSAQAVRRRVAAGHWARVLPRVYRSTSHLLAILRRAAIIGWVVNLRIGGWEADVAFPEARLAIEIDSWAWHVDTDRFHGDRRKQNALVVGGWTVLRFTWQDITRRPDHIVALLRKALAHIA